jgi:hypothetical protein
MNLPSPYSKALFVAAFLLTSFSIDTQMRRPQANVTRIVETNGVHPGTTSRVALQVSLPDNLHVQSNRPRDPLLIPTVLTIEPPPGVTLRNRVSASHRSEAGGPG